VSHPIPLPHADRLERALLASSRFVAARGGKGWVARIWAFFACQYECAVIELLQDLLAEYRAGTLVLPAMVDDSSTSTADDEARKPRAAARRSRRPASPRTRAPGANDPCAVPAEAPEQGAAAPRRMHVNAVPRPQPIRRRDHGPRGITVHPSVVARWPREKFGAWGPALSHPHFVAFSK
jgi:hypothetical protein